MALIYCGIDEAGYGPMLGPLCVGFSAFRIEHWDPDAGAPDLWRVLEGAVCRKGRDARGRIAVADSKKLKLSNQSKTRHPLTHLERGVLAFGGLVRVPHDHPEPAGASVGKSPTREHGVSTERAIHEETNPVLARGAPSPAHVIDTDTSLFTALGTHLEPHDWYAGDAVSLPLAGSAAQLAIARNRLALTCEAAGVEPIALACIAVGETEFNEAIRTGGSKSHLTTRCFARYLRRVVERWGGGKETSGVGVSPADDIRIICDRHGGRTSYAPMIEAAVRGLGFEVETLEETDRCSRYAIRGTGFQPVSQGSDPAPSSESDMPPDIPASGDAPSRTGWKPVPRIHIQFRPEAEEAHLPVALASMTAKLVRELAMSRFNRYWSGRIPGLKPTAGYVQDARRWLDDVEGVLCDDEREAMVRKA